MEEKETTGVPVPPEQIHIIEPHFEGEKVHIIEPHFKGKKIAVIGHGNNSPEVLRLMEKAKNEGIIILTPQDVADTISGQKQSMADLKTFVQHQLTEVDQQLYSLTSGFHEEESSSLKELKRKNLSPETLRQLLNSPSARMEGETQEQYKKRRSLKKLIEKHRTELHFSE